ncbi:MAG: hypothetical protein LBU32_18265 [Clostridiales bacterium]|jgi:hypothetical protein|nr:hypothetical protein [Clostridiales bacterium]
MKEEMDLKEFSALSKDESSEANGGCCWTALFKCFWYYPPNTVSVKETTSNPASPYYPPSYYAAN